jgi:hypothetical protein
MAEGPVAVTPAQLLMLNPNAYINLILMFPLPEGVKKEEDIPAFELPANFRLFAVTAHDVVLVSKNPPSIFAYDEKAYAWKPMKVTPEKG